MAQTNFETRFLIGARYTGASEVAKANRGIDSVERNLKGMGGAIGRAQMGFVSFGKIAGGVFAGIAAAAVTRKIIQFGDAAIDAATGVAKAHDQLGAALARNQSRYNMTGKALATQKKRFIDLAEAQEKAGGFDAEIMERGWTKLLDTLSPQQIEKFSQSYSDMVAKLTDGAPTEQDAVEIAEQYNQTLIGGRPALLRRLNATKAEKEEFKKLNTQEERRLFLDKLMLKYAGETQRQSKTTTGQIRLMKDAIGNLFETFGKPFVDRAGSFATSFRKMAKALTPLAESIAEKLAPAFETLSNWVAANDKRIVKWLEDAVDWFWKLWDAIKWAWDLLNSVPVIWDIKKDWPDITRWFHDLIENTKKEIEEITKLIEKFKEFFRLLDPNWNAQSTTPPIATTPPGYMMTEPQRKAAEQAHTASEAAHLGTGWGTPREPKILKEGDVAAGGSAALAKARAGLVAEVNADPALREKLMRVAQAETGTSDPTRLAAFYETVYNRAAVRGQTMARTLNPDYYETLRGGRTGKEPLKRELHESTLKAIAAGSNVSDYATGNFAYRGGGLGGKGGYATKWFGEQFSVQAADVRKIEELKRADRAAATTGEDTIPLPGGGYAPYTDKAPLKDVTQRLNKQRAMGVAPMNITMSPQTTINGASAGQEKALAREFDRVLQDSNRAALAKLKELREDQDRTGYV